MRSSWLWLSFVIGACSSSSTDQTNAAVATSTPAESPQSAASVAAAVKPSEKWWNPPHAPHQQVEALAYAFAGIDENDLGMLFSLDLKPIRASTKLFEDKPLRRVPRDEMNHLVVKLRDSSHLSAGLNYLMLKAGVTRDAEHDYEVVRAMQIQEVVRLDETARMRFPPEEATFYLAEVHRGASYDVLVVGEHAEMGAKLEARLAQGGGNFEVARKSSRYKLRAFGLGLRDISGDAIFSRTPGEIAASYRTGDPVPVQLVFRVIPGRNYSPDRVPIPEPVVDEPALALGEGQSKQWSFERSASLLIKATSAPDGAEIRWSGEATCTPSLSNAAYRELTTRCRVKRGATLTAKNPTTLGFGPTEKVSIYVARVK